METALQTLLDFCVNSSLPLILALCILDIVFGIGAALRSGLFDWKKVGQFYKTQVLALLLPYIAVLTVTAFVSEIVDFLPVALAPAAMLAGIVANLVGSIATNVGKTAKPG